MGREGERETDSCLLFAQYNETRRPLNIYRKPPSSTPIVNSWLATRTKSGRRIKKEKGINDNKNDWDFSSIDKKEDGHIVTDPTPCLNKSALSVADVARVLNPGLSYPQSKNGGRRRKKNSTQMDLIENKKLSQIDCCQKEKSICGGWMGV